MAEMLTQATAERPRRPLADWLAWVCWRVQRGDVDKNHHSSQDDLYAATLHLLQSSRQHLFSTPQD